MLQYNPYIMPFRYIIYYILLMLSPSVTKAQRPNIQLSEAQFHESPTAQSAAFLSNTYQDLAHWFEYAPQFNVDSTQYYIDKAITVVESIKPEPYQALAKAYYNAAKFYRELTKAEDLIAKSYAYWEKIPSSQRDKQLQYDILNFWAVVMVRASERTRGIELFQQAYTLNQNDKSPHVQAKLLQDAVSFYYNFDQDEQREERFKKIQKSLQIYLSLNDPKVEPDIINLYGLSTFYFFEKEQFDSSFAYLKKIKILLPNLHDPNRDAWYDMIYGSAAMKVKRYDEAKEHIRNALKILETYRLTKSDNYQYSWFLLGSIADEQGEYDKAIEYFTKSKDIAKVKNNQDAVISTLDCLAKVYEKKGDFNQAYVYQKQYTDEVIKQKKEQYDKGIKEFQIKLDTEEKEKELVKQKAKQNVYIACIAVAGLLLGFLGFVYYRERKSKTRLEAQNHIIVKQSEALRHLDVAKTRFFANVSHELRTPLTLMLAPLSTMIKSDTLDNKNFTLASLIRQNAQGLLKLVNEILDLNKLEAGKLELHKEPVVVYNLIRRLLANFESHAEQQNIRFTFNYEPDKYLQLSLDINKFEKIINNLMSNALKFTPTEGAISVTVKDLQNRLQIEVMDTGRGIHPDDMPHVFNRFYQSNQPDAATEGGTGIGLSLSMELARLFGGTLSVESTLGEGSTFVFELPKKEVLGSIQTQEAEKMLQKPILAEGTAEAVNLMAIPRTNGDNTKSTLLIVEDNQSLRDYLTLILEPHYQILKAENGQVALDILAKQNKVDLILSDVMMPIMDGFQLLSNLKTSEVYCSIPVVMLTARAELQDKLKALRIGVDDYLIKPFEEEELLARIDNLLKNAQNRQAAQQESLAMMEIKELNAPDIRHPKSDIQNPTSDIQNPTSEIPSPPLSIDDQKWLSELENVLRENISDYNLSTDRIADRLYISRSQFYRRVRLLTGLTPIEYLQEVRFNHARLLLEQRTVSSVKSAAAAVGMRQVQNFSQHFKERFGKLPSEYLG